MIILAALKQKNCLVFFSFCFYSFVNFIQISYEIRKSNKKFASKFYVVDSAPEL